jgi:glycerophosphoryl diester phosphodiesterase
MDPLLIDVPERMETARLVLRAPRAGDGGALNEAVRASSDEIAPWMPWAGLLPRALLLDSLRAGWLDEARALGCAGVVMQHALFDAPVRDALRGAGLAAGVYTVNDPAEARRLDALGVDSIGTDAVDRFSPGRAVAD